MENNRNSGMETLRILAAFLIVMYHYAVYGGISYNSYYSKDLLNGLFAQFLAMGGNVGSMIFISIMGYYQSEKPFNTSHLIRIIFQMFFYSTLIYLIFCITGNVQFNFWNFLRSLLPFFFDRWFFGTAYIVLYCLSPFINKFLNTLDKENFKRLLIVQVALWMALPTVLGFFDGTVFYGTIFTVYLTAYTSGAYIRRFASESDIAGKYRKTLIISVIVMLASALVFDMLGEHIGIFYRKGTYFSSLNSIFTYATVFCLTALASQTEPKTNSMINNVASTSFGVYLLCSHAYTRELIFKRIIKAPEQIKSVLFIVLALLSCLAVYTICVIIDYIRKFTIEKNLLKSFDSAAQKINAKAYATTEKISEEP